MFRKRPPAALWLPAVLSGLVALAPLWYLATQAGGRGWQAVADELLQRRTLDLVVRSLALCAAVTAACIVIGTFAAWVVVHSGLPGRTLITVAFSLPLAIPSYLSAFAWIDRWPGLSGFWGAFIVLTFATFPYVMLPVTATLSRMDPTHEDVARALGRSSAGVLFGVVLPQARRSIAAGALLVALYVLSDFGAVATMRHEVFTWVIYGAYRAGFNPARAAILSLVLVLMALVLTGAEARVRGRGSRASVGRGGSHRRSPAGRPARVAAAAGTLLVVLPSVGVPVTGVLDWLGRDTVRTVTASEVWGAALNSFGIGIAVAVVTLAAALPVALLSVRHPGGFSRGVEASTFVTHSLPGIVVAISVVYLGVRAARPLYQEWPMVVFAHVILFVPVMVATVKSSLEKSGRSVEEVAHSLGAGPVEAFLRVTVPLAAPGLLAGTALTMLAAVKELPATLLLRPTGFETLSTEIWTHSSVSDYAAVGPHALVMLVLAVVPTAVLGTLTGMRGNDR